MLLENNDQILRKITPFFEINLEQSSYPYNQQLYEQIKLIS